MLSSKRIYLLQLFINQIKEEISEGTWGGKAVKKIDFNSLKRKLMANENRLKKLLVWLLLGIQPI